MRLNVKRGWIPYDDRSKMGQRLTDEFHEQIRTFGAVGSEVELPKKVVLHEIEIKVLGKLMARPYQFTGSCLPSDASVLMADGSEKPIADVQVDDVVVSHSGQPRRVLGTIARQSAEKMRRIRVDGVDRVLHATDGHVVPRCSGSSLDWVRCDQIAIGDLMPVSGPRGALTRVVSNDALGVHGEPVWDIEVEHDHTFIADGFSVHNCVGVSGMRSGCHAQLGDVYLRGDNEEIKILFPFATYGRGRQIAGKRGPGSGSYGAAQAKAEEQFGVLPIDWEKAPKPTITDTGWIKYSKAIELSWSHPNSWPIPFAEVEAEANKNQIRTITRLRTPEEVCQSLAQCYGVTMAGDFGTNPRVEGDVLLGRRSTVWAHQQSVSGYWFHPTHGLIFLIDNQWLDVHGHDPGLYPLGVTGSYWILEKDMATELRTGEVYSRSNTEGFPLRRFDWSNILSL